jgi:hypothetical protein
LVTSGLFFFFLKKKKRKKERKRDTHLSEYISF